jgi:peptide/nickel transport system ATP-binding protein
MSLLEINGLRVTIGAVDILHDVSLSVKAGEIVGVIGESGSGKSMTALSVMQLLPRGAACSGDIKLSGHDILDIGEARMCGLRGQEVGMVFQEPMTALNPLQTIGDQVAETILIHEDVSRAEARERAQEALRRVELLPGRVAMSRYPHELSGGQRQRVCIAIATALRPKLLIADEPTTALDVTTQAGVLRLLRRLVTEDGMGLLLISHDLGVVAEMADQIIIMQKGHVVETGQFGDLQQPYALALMEASDHRPKRAGRIGQAALLQVREVVREYSTPSEGWFATPEIFRAVDHVSFDIQRGENLGLVGESGCGKSTLARAILGLEDVQGGTITFDKQPVFDGHRTNRAVRRRVQMVFQDPYGSFNPRWTVARSVAEPFHLLDDPPKGALRNAAVVDALENVGLSPDDQYKYIHEFSGGQRQRIALARALIIRPDLIILDEAISALDVQVRARLLDLLAGLSDRLSLTYLFISHDLSVVRNVTDRVLVMQEGRIVEEGETEAVFAAPRHPYTRGLIDAAPRLPKVC